MQMKPRPRRAPENGGQQPRRGILVLTLLCMVFASLPAAAQDDSDSKARAKRAAEAERLKRVAMGLAKRAKYEEAFAAFESVLPLVDYPDDQVLYNLGAIAYEALKDCSRAVLYFHGYLYAAPGDPSAGQVRQRLAACQKRVKNRGTIIVTGEPEGAEVRINDVILGRIPVAPLVVPAGQYRIAAKKSEYDDHAAEITVDTGLETRHEATLRKKVYLGNIRVVTDPPGATVFINEVKVGTAPVMKKNLPTKRYLVRVEKKGMDRWIRYVSVDRGMTTEVEAELESTGVNVRIPPLPQ